MSSPSVDSPTGPPRIFTVLLAFAAGVISLAGLHAMSSIAGPVFLALMLTIAVHPLHRVAARFHLPGWVGVAAGLLAAYLVLITLAVSLSVSLARFGTLLPSYQAEFNSLLNALRTQLAALGVGNDQIRAVLAAFDFGRIAGYVGSFLSALAGVFSSLLLIVVLLLFMGIDAGRFPERVMAARATRPLFADALVSFAVGTRRYLVVSTVFGLIVAAIDVLVLWILGVPVPLLWGLLAFITNYIPNIGFVLGLVPPAALALLEGGPSLMIWVIVAYCVINVVIQTIIQPKFVGDAVGLSGTLTFLSLIFWAWMLGPLGALLAIPLTLLLKALLVEADPKAAWASPFLTGGPLNPEPKPSKRRSLRRPPKNEV